VQNKRRLSSSRLHDDVTFGLYTWHCLNSTRVRLFNLQTTSFVEFRRWHSYPPEESSLRVVHLGYVLKPFTLERSRAAASSHHGLSCPEGVWHNMSRQSMLALPTKCEPCAQAWHAASDVMPHWTCCHNQAHKVDRARPAEWDVHAGCVAAL